MKFRRADKYTEPLKGEFIFSCPSFGVTFGENAPHHYIITDKRLNEYEQELLSSVIEWSYVDSGTINDQRWHDYVNNINSPVWEGNELVFTGDDWSLDYWELLFDEY